MSSDWGKIFGSFKNWYIHCNIIIYEHRLSNKYKQDELWANAHLYDTPALRQTGSRNLTGQKTLPTIWGTYMKLWPNIRFLPSIVAEKNATKNEHICSMCIKINKVSKQEVGIWWVQKRFPQYGIPIWNLWPNIRDFVDFYTHWTYMLIFRRIFLSNYWWQKSDISSQSSYWYAIMWKVFLDPSDSYFLFADLVGFYPLANEVAKGYSNATVRPSVFPSFCPSVTSLWTL
jgi:hypothetical protein